MGSSEERVRLHALTDDVVQVTLPIPFGLAHVNCYFVRGDDGAWTLVDAGFRDDDPQELWEPVLRSLDGPVDRVVITHYHPDHLGGAADAAEVAGAELMEGELDFQQAVAAWADPGAPQREAAYFLEHGMPADMAAAVARRSTELSRSIRLRRPDRYLRVGDDVAGWEVRHYAGHADGHLTLARGAELIGGDVLLAQITPNVGRYPESSDAPLDRYLATLDRIVADNWDVVYSGHRAVVDDPAARAAETRTHHRERLAQLRSALAAPATAFTLSYALFPAALNPEHRRFAVAETLAHLEFLEAREEVERSSCDGEVRFAART